MASTPADDLTEDSPPIGFSSEEEYQRFAREVLIPRYEAMKADPSQCITLEQLKEEVKEWDREDALLEAAHLKRWA